MSFLRIVGFALAATIAWAPPAGALDATFAGRWRVVEAQRAPWARGEQPYTLARTGLIFLENRMLGHGPLTCEDARYETVLSQPDGLFQGALGTQAESAAAALGLEGGITTLRVICSTGSYDFHHRGGTDLLIGYDNVIYTLRRPEDPGEPREDSAFIAPVAASFRCEAARTTAEQLICSDDRLARADVAMAREFMRLRGELTGDNATALRNAQRTWLAFIRQSCDADGAMPTHDEARRDATRCLTGETEFQGTFYSGLRIVTAGPFRIEPRIGVSADVRRKILDVDVIPVAIGGPAQRQAALRAYLERRLPTSRPRRTARDVAGTEFRQTYTRDYQVHRADARLLSLSVTSRLETGVRVPNVVRALNWDVETNRPLTLADLFRPGADWQAIVMAALEREAEPHFTEPARTAALRQMREIDRWSFEADRAVVRFTGGALPLGADPAEIEIPVAELLALLRPGAPWRPVAER